MDLDERAVALVGEAEALGATDLRGALAKMREALALEPDYPNLEDEIFIREDAIAKLDGLLEYIVVLLRESKDYQACQMLQGLPDSYIIVDKSGLVGGLKDKIAKVAGLVDQAGGLTTANGVGALALLEAAFKLVPDYPGLAEAVAAHQQEVARYTSYLGVIEKALKRKDAKNATSLLVGFRDAFPDDENVNRFKVAIINLTKDLKTRKIKKINLLKIIGAVGVVLAAAGAYFTYEMVMIKKASHQWQEVNRLLAAQKFTETQDACRNIRANLGRVRLFFLDGKQELQGKVNAVLQSELVVKGAEGKILFDGDYIPKEQLVNSQEIKKHIDEARALAAAGDGAAAIGKFKEAQAATTGLDAKTAAAVVSDIELAITGCRLDLVGEQTAKAGALLATGSYDGALAGITAAIAQVTEHALDPGEPVVAGVFAVKRKIDQAKLTELMTRGDKLFVAGRYEPAIKAYEQARTFAETSELDHEPLKGQISGMIDKSKVRAAVGSGDRYLAAGQWLEAVRAYESGRALAVKSDLRNLPSFQGAEVNLRTARKMQLVADLTRQGKTAGRYVADNNGKEARNVFEQAIKAGAGSAWRGDKEVVAVLAKLERGLAELEEKTFVADKKEFLRERYGAILKKDFALAGEVALLDPEVLLLAATPELLKFRVSALTYTQKDTQGQYSRYEATYAFDRQRAVWSLVDKSSASQPAADRNGN